MVGYKFVLEAVLLGIAFTLLTGLYNSTPHMLVGAVWYGLPLAWIRYLVIAPQYNPWAADYIRLVADICIWTAVAGLLVYAKRILKKKRR